MNWLDNLFGSPGVHKYKDGDEECQYEYPRNNNAGLWQGPNIFEDPWKDERWRRQDDANNSYYNDIKTSPNIPNTDDLHNTNAESAFGEAHISSGREASPPVEEDVEDLAKAMQESMSLQYPPPYGSSSVAPLYPIVAPRSLGISTCAGCNKPLGFGRFLSCLGQNWHPSCFRCRLCSKAIADREFSVQGNEPYHRDCYKEVFHPKCEICHNFIPTNVAGLIEYRSHPFWNQKYCPSHERDGTPRCCSCDRLEPAGTKYLNLEDGRKLCSECVESSLMDNKECQPLYRDILWFYKQLGMMIDQEIPVLLVERSALNAARDGEKEGHTHTPETRGLCLSEEQTIMTVFSKRPKAHGGYPLLLKTESQKLVRHCEVTAILVLYGLPRLLTGSILAHELMHAWLRLNGTFPNLSNEVEEGICQVMSHIWLEAELKKLRDKSRSSSSSSSSKRANSATLIRLGEFFLHQIATDSSPVYGDGFRAGIGAVTAFGLVRTLEHLRITGNFPA